MLGCYSSCFFLVKESPPKVSQAEIGWTPRNNPKETTSAGLGQPKNPSGGIFLFILLWFRVFSDPKNFTALIGEVKILHQDFSIQHSNKINTCSWICWCISWFLPEQNPKRRGEDLAQQAEIGRFTYLGVPPPQGLSPPYGLGNEVDALSIRSKHVCVCRNVCV